MRIGAHISSAGGISKVFARGREVDAEAIQLFLSAPQQWRLPAISDAEAGAFVAERERTGIPVFAHAAYLVNLGSADETILGRSIESLVASLAWCCRLGIEGLIVHAGSHLGRGYEAVLPQVSQAIIAVLERTPGTARLIIENNAGQGGGIGASFAELGAVIRACDGDGRLAVCLDTCHAFAMGYDIRTGDGVAATMDQFERSIGLERLAVVHANDSKTPLAGVRDRHENIGDGYIGMAGFQAIVGHPAFAAVPFVLEVPGLDGKGPDLENVRRLKSIRDSGLPPTQPSENVQ